MWKAENLPVEKKEWNKNKPEVVKAKKKQNFKGLVQFLLPPKIQKHENWASTGFVDKKTKMAWVKQIVVFLST